MIGPAIRQRTPAMTEAVATWFLIIAIGSGWGSVSDVRFAQMTGPQCRAALESLKPLIGSIGAVCVGPDGERVEIEDLK